MFLPPLLPASHGAGVAFSLPELLASVCGVASCHAVVNLLRAALRCWNLRGHVSVIHTLVDSHLVPHTQARAWSRCADVYLFAFTVVHFLAAFFFDLVLPVMPIPLLVITGWDTGSGNVTDTPSFL